MAFSMHSHSGQFCPGHAKDGLEAIIQTAISKGFKTFACTEHMPRTSPQDLYPEEIEAGDTIEALVPRHEAFIFETLRLREKYASQIKILIGFEGEWVRPDYAPVIQKLTSNPAIDFFIGSVHHVHGIPIDYDSSFFSKAVEKAGSEEKLFEDYFDAQYEMLQALEPKVVGHFDLIRLLATDPNKDLRSLESLWLKAVRNLEFVVEYGGLLEINTSALRKGLKEPYPSKSICEAFIALGGKFTLSDDSHGIVQVGTNYERAFGYLDILGVKEAWALSEKVSLEDVRESFGAKI